MLNNLNTFLNYATIIFLIIYLAFNILSIKNEKHKTAKNIKTQIVFDLIICVLYFARFIISTFMHNAIISLVLSLLCAICFGFAIGLDYNRLKRIAK